MVGIGLQDAHLELKFRVVELKTRLKWQHQLVMQAMAPLNFFSP